MEEKVKDISEKKYCKISKENVIKRSINRVFRYCVPKERGLDYISNDGFDCRTAGC